MNPRSATQGRTVCVRSSCGEVAPGRRAVLLLGMSGAWACAGASNAAMPSWLGGDKVTGSGSVRASSRDPGRFTGIALGVPGVLEVRIGAAESLTIEVDDNLLPLIVVRVVNGVLEIRPVRDELRLEPTRLHMVATTRQLERLSVSGEGAIVVPVLSSTALKVEVAGAGSVSVRQLSADAVALAIGGAGRIDIAGTARTVSLAIGGVGEVRAGSLRASQVSVELAGAGRARVWATERLTVALAGAGEVSYYGDARLSQSVAGVGRVRRLGAAPAS